MANIQSIRTSSRQRDLVIAEKVTPEPEPEAPVQRRHRRLRRGPSLATWFVIIGLTFGVCFAMLVPAFQGLDEPNQLFRTWNITSGDIISPIVPANHTEYTGLGEVRVRGYNFVGGQVPDCVLEYVNRAGTAASIDRPIPWGDSFGSPTECNHNGTTWLSFDNTGGEPAFAYFPEVVGLGVLRALHAPIPVLFFGGRLVGVVAYVLLVALAIRITPRGKGVLFVIGLLPTALTVASSYSADSWTNALALLSVALAIRCRTDERSGRMYFLWLALTLIALACAKSGYFILTPLILLVPSARLGWSRWWAGACKALVVLVGLGVGAFWARVASKVNQAPFISLHSNPHAQTQWALHHPLLYLDAFIRTYALGGSQSPMVSGMVSILGFGRNQMSGEFAPIALVLLAFAMLLVAYLAEWGPRQPWLGLRTAASAALPLAIGAVGLLFIFTAVWLWLPVGTAAFNGEFLSGKYFIPLLPLPLLTVVVLRRPRGMRDLSTWLIAGVIALLVWELAKVFIRFY